MLFADSANPQVPSTDDLLIVELDDRIEFGVPLLDTDLEADGINNACANGDGCTALNTAGCHNVQNCC